ncbi:MAG: efflux RND transporter permease subunit [Gammaproteobacteria bacterium]|nr:efflux RND transporter permease subunit [Gammaproteobacteria bacterium]
MISFISAAMLRARTTLAILVLLLVSGILTYRAIPKEANPDVVIPYIYISIVHDGISPEDAERMLLRPMENELRGLSGIKQMESTASEGHGSVLIEFMAGMDPKAVLADVRDRVTLAKAKLPEGAEEPVIEEIKMEDENPTITVILSGDVPERTLVQLGRDLRDRLEALPEVLEVELAGEREEMVEIIVDPLLLESYNLNQGDIYELLSRNNQLVAAGNMDTGVGRHAVKVPAVFEDLEDVLKLPIKAVGERLITFADVADVRRSFKDANSYARLNGEPALSLEVKKRTGENILTTVEKVRAIVDGAKQLFPAHVQVTYTNDMSEEVRDMLHDLQNNVVSAVILVVIVVIAFLGVRSAALVAVAIPGSFLAGILILGVMGYTINIVVLFALIMAVGMLVDGVIVVTEFADRCMAEGMDRREAYSLAARRMAWPIIASTATTLAAFAPLIFWPGIMGEFMKYLPITLIVTLTASLFMALLFVPTLGSLIGKPRQISEHERHQLEDAESGDIRHVDGFTGGYVKVLDGALARPGAWLTVALITAVAVVVLFARHNAGIEFFPQVEPAGVNMVIRSHGDLSIDEKDRLMKQVEARILDMQEIESLYSRTGNSGRRGERVGYLRLNLVDWDQRRPADQIIDEVRQRTADMAGVEIELRKDENGPGGGKALEVELSSRYPQLVNDAVKTVRLALEENGGFTNIDDDATKPGIEWQLQVDRADAARFGADAALLGASVQLVTNGLKLGEYRPDDVDYELDIRVRFPAEQRHLERLDGLRVLSERGLVPVSNFVERVAKPKTDTIRRVDSRRVITVSADMKEGRLLATELPRLQKLLPTLNLDPRVVVNYRGENEEQDESSLFLEKAFLVALFIMTIILVAQFNSYYQTLLILSAVVLSTVGVLLGMLLLQQPFGIVMSGIGVISLAGIVVNNNIILIDTYNLLRAEGMAAREALLRTGAQRLRPVLLTTSTTILGLMPMVLQVNIDLIKRTVEVGGPSTQWWSQLATAIAGGLTFATVLTLVLTPCLLMVGANVDHWWRQRRQPALTAGEVKLQDAA